MWRSAWAGVAACAVLIAGGCAGTPRSTRLQPTDIDDRIAEVRESLAGSAFVREGRGGGGVGGAVLVAMTPINASNERLSASDQLVPVRQVLTDAGVRESLSAAGIRVAVTPRERDAELRDLVLWDPREPLPGVSAEDRPTHGMRTEFRSRTRAASLSGSGPADARRDFFTVTFSVVEISTGAVVWAHEVEVSRVGFGRLAD